MNKQAEPATGAVVDARAICRCGRAISAELVAGPHRGLVARADSPWVHDDTSKRGC